MLKEGIVIGERYEIISHIGAGGMADVYKARDHKLNRLVAVKVLKAEFRQDTNFVAKFRKEAQAAAGLSHPNVVNVFDVGEDRGLYYIVMELVEGITLKEYIAKKGKLSVRESTSIAIQVSLGLEAAHSQGIVHRDVKPQNIIISTDGKVKLSDFGIAKAINSNTITANVMGSVHYSSPEQVRGGFSDTKSDIYSLGITLYEMVTGRVPFDGDSTVAIAIKHLQEEIVPPSKFAPDLPYSLEQIILKMTQKNPERRYQVMGEVIEDLKKSLSDPQGNFVTLTPLRSHASTLSMTKAETAAINEAAEKKTPSRKAPMPEIEEEDQEEEEEERPARKHRSYDNEDDGRSSGLEKAITIGGFLIGAVIIIILVIVVGNMLGLFGNGSKSSGADVTVTAEAGDITVPDFSGMTLAEAQNTARDLNIGIKQSSTEASDTVEQGHIISQDVAAGQTVTANTTINVVISSGSNSTAIPAGLAGMAQADAENALTALGLTSTVVNEASDSVEAGYVISTDPAEGSSVAVGTSVTLHVSSGPDAGGTVSIPDLRGYDQDSAISVLDSMGLPSVVVSGSDDELEDGQVISVSPDAGTEVAAGTEVTVTVNGAASTSESTGTWVCVTNVSEPYEYNGGNVTLELVQGDTTTTVFDGGSPWAEDGSCTASITGKDGETSGTINIYEDGNLIAQEEVEFQAP